jgi:hypothetical protein
MTCSSCACEFCYLCGRRYIKIPIIGQHNNKFRFVVFFNLEKLNNEEFLFNSMLGCPYNLHPEKPWLRRTIRGVIATGIVVASPLIVAGAVTAAVTVLPSIGIYRFVKNTRNRRRALRNAQEILAGDRVSLNEDHDRQQFELFNRDLDVEEILRRLREYNPTIVIQTIEEDFPLSIFADMDVEHLFVEDDKLVPGFKTCPTTPEINMRAEHETINHLSAEEN